MKKMNFALCVIGFLSGIWLVAVGGGYLAYLGWASILVSCFAVVVGLLAHKKQKELPNLN